MFDAEFADAGGGVLLLVLVVVLSSATSPSAGGYFRFAAHSDAAVVGKRKSTRSESLLAHLQKLVSTKSSPFIGLFGLPPSPPMPHLGASGLKSRQWVSSFWDEGASRQGQRGTWTPGKSPWSGGSTQKRFGMFGVLGMSLISRKPLGVSMTI